MTKPISNIEDTLNVSADIARKTPINTGSYKFIICKTPWMKHNTTGFSK